MNMQTMSRIACEVKDAWVHPVVLVGEDEVKAHKQYSMERQMFAEMSWLKTEGNSGSSIKHPVVRQLLHNSKQNRKREGGTKVL